MEKETAQKPGTTARRPPASPEYKSPQEVILAYVAWRKAGIAASLGPPGVNRGGGAAVQAQSILTILGELESFATWLGDGQPTPAAVLSEDDKVFWRRARSQGLDVPQDVLDKL